MPAKPSSLRAGLAAALLVLAALGVYARAVDVPFLWDDRELVLADPAVSLGQPLGRYFTAPFWPNPDEPRAFFRPLVTLSYRLDYLAHGARAPGFHLTNLVFHALNVGLLFALARRAGAGLLAATLGAAGFALMPRLTEDVTWISGRTDVLASSFVLGALLAWPAPDADRRAARVWAASTLLVLGLACKEVALAGWVAIVVLELTSRPAAARARLATLGPPVAVVLGFLAWRHHVLGGAPVDDGLHGLASRLAACAASWGTYGWMLVDAFHPLLQIEAVDHAPALAVAGGVLAMVLLAWAITRLVKKRSAIAAAALAMAGAAIALVSHLAPIPVNVLAADRFLYLPTAGLGLALAVAATRGTPRAVAAVACAWIAASGAATAARNAVLSDELGLWVETAERSFAGDPVPINELGNVLFRGDAWAEASTLLGAMLGSLEAAGTTGGSVYLDAAASRASCLSYLGDYEGALRLRFRVVAARPGSARAWLDLARVELHLLRYSESLDAIAHAAAARGHEAEDLTARVAELRAAEPAKGSPPFARARFDANAGRRFEAEREWLRALEAPDAAPRDVLEGAVFLSERGSIASAEAAASRVSRDPSLAREAAAIEGIVEERRRFEARLAELRPRIEAIDSAAGQAGPSSR